MLHERVHKTPADGGIEHLGLTLVWRGRLAHHERRAGHRLYATGNHQVRIARFNGTGGEANRIKTRTAQTVNSGAGNAVRIARQQRRHMRNVTVIFPGLVGAAENDVVDTGWV